MISRVIYKFAKWVCMRTFNFPSSSPVYQALRVLVLPIVIHTNSQSASLTNHTREQTHTRTRLVDHQPHPIIPTINLRHVRWRESKPHSSYLGTFEQIKSVQTYGKPISAEALVEKVAHKTNLGWLCVSKGACF